MNPSGELFEEVEKFGATRPGQRPPRSKVVEASNGRATDRGYRPPQCCRRLPFVFLPEPHCRNVLAISPPPRTCNMATAAAAAPTHCRPEKRTLPDCHRPERSLTCWSWVVVQRVPVPHWTQPHEDCQPHWLNVVIFPVKLPLGRPN